MARVLAFIMRPLRAMQRLKALPVVMDLLEDRVQTRALSTILFAFLLLFVLRAVLFVVFLFTVPEVRMRIAGR